MRQRLWTSLLGMGILCLNAGGGFAQWVAPKVEEKPFSPAPSSSDRPPSPSPAPSEPKKTDNLESRLTPPDQETWTAKMVGLVVHRPKGEKNWRFQKVTWASAKSGAIAAVLLHFPYSDATSSPLPNTPKEGKSPLGAEKNPASTTSSQPFPDTVVVVSALPNPMLEMMIQDKKTTQDKKMTVTDYLKKTVAVARESLQGKTIQETPFTKTQRQIGGKERIVHEASFSGDLTGLGHQEKIELIFVRTKTVTYTLMVRSQFLPEEISKERKKEVQTILDQIELKNPNEEKKEGAPEKKEGQASKSQ